jgi:uncharacterized protein YndB with AHSA1/START domain
LRLEHMFAAPPALVFSIFTTPALISAWFASSHGFRAHDVKVDLRPGGVWRLRNVKGDIAEHVWGTFHEVIRDDRLCYSYHFEGTDFFSIVSLRFEPRGTSTALHFCQTGFPDDQAFIEHSRGWPLVLRIIEDAVLAAHGVGTVWQGSGAQTLDGVARDLEAARLRLEEERNASAKK